jgi:glutaredoxin
VIFITEGVDQKVRLEIFWKKDCPNCPKAKEIGKILSPLVEVQYFDIDTVDGLSEACLKNVMSTPTIVLMDSDNHEIESWRGLIPELDHIRDKIAN